MRPSRTRIEKRSKKFGEITQRKVIIESLEILMSRIVDYGAEEVCQVMGYNNGNPFVRKASLLPDAYIDFPTLNGESDTLIFFTNEPPLLDLSAPM